MTTRPASMRPMEAYNSRTNSPLPSPTKSPRRVLGELTPNAKLTPKILQTGAKSPVKTTPINSPLKAQDALSTSAMILPKESDSSVFTSSSRKRPFSAIASPERLDATRSSVKRQHDMGPQTVSPAALRSPLPPPIYVMEHESSADEDESLEDSNEHDAEHMELPTATQGTNGSFSSLIDYNPDNASDRSDPATVTPPSSRSASMPVTSRVELLKLRLKMAMYKINTNQTLVPFAMLEPPHIRVAHELGGEADEQEEDGMEYASPVQPLNALSSTRRMDSEVSSADVALQNIVITGGAVAKLLEGPVLAPTAYSTRFLSAPMLPASPMGVMSEDAIEQQRTPNGPYGDERDLTSSVVKGHAASGLLELAHSR